MPTPSPRPPWYQFSLRSLLLLTLFVAALCSFAVYTHWIFSVLIGSIVLIGGVAGWIVARTRLGFVQGVVTAIPFFLIAVLICGVLMFVVPGFGKTLWWVPISGATVLIGDILGGLMVRPRSKR
jgi:hypothetical protein